LLPACVGLRRSLLLKGVANGNKEQHQKLFRATCVHHRAVVFTFHCTALNLRILAHNKWRNFNCLLAAPQIFNGFSSQKRTRNKLVSINYKVLARYKFQRTAAARRQRRLDFIFFVFG
jgi:hypothetical protein